MTKLKQLLSINPQNMSKSQVNDFFKELKKSSLLLAIDNDSKPLKLNQNNKTFVCLFSDEEELNNFGAFSFIRYNIEDLTNLLIQQRGIDNIVINPASDNPFAMNIDYFISNTSKNNNFDIISIFNDIVKKGVKPLDDISIVYLREKEPFLNTNTVDDIFTSPIPICVSFDEEFNNDYKYINEIYLPKGTLISNSTQDIKNYGDIIIAPILKLRKIDKSDNKVTWQCINQDFNIF